MRLVLHLGAHRTGSSLLQSIFRTAFRYDPNARLFRSGRCGFVDTADPDLSAATMRFFQAWRAGSEPTVGAELFRALYALGSPHVDHLVYSNENLCGGLNALGHYHKAPYVAAALQAAELDDVRVVIYIRRQASWVTSFYTQHSLHADLEYESGIVPSFLEFSGRVPLERLSWGAYVQPFVDVLGEKNVTVIPTEALHVGGPDAYVEDFAARFWPCTPPGAMDGVRGDRSMIHERRSLSARGRAVVQAARTVLPPEELAALAMYAEGAFPPRTGEHSLRLPALLDAAMTHHYEESNRRVFDRFVPTEFHGLFSSHYAAPASLPDPDSPVPRVQEGNLPGWFPPRSTARAPMGRDQSEKRRPAYVHTAGAESLHPGSHGAPSSDSAPDPPGGEQARVRTDARRPLTRWLRKWIGLADAEVAK